MLMKFRVLVYDHESITSQQILGWSDIQVQRYRLSKVDPTLIPDDLPGIITLLLGDLQM